LPPWEKVIQAILLFFHDRSFFYSKLKYKLGITNGRSLNQHIIQNASFLLSQDSYEEVF